MSIASSNRREGARKQWVFTLNNYTSDEYGYLKQRIAKQVTYAIIGEESGPSRGTPHLQGYVYLKKRVRSAGIKDVIGARAYISSATGGLHKNRDYYSKDNRFCEHGFLPVIARSSTGDGRPLHQFAQAFAAVVSNRASLMPLLEKQPFYTLQHANKWLQSYNTILSMGAKDRESVICF